MTFRELRPALPKKKSPASAEDRLSAVIDGISDVYYALDHDWRVIMFNSAAETFFGMKRKDLMGRRFQEIFPQGAGTPFQALIERALTKGKGGRLTLPSVLRAGRHVDIRVSSLGELGVGVAIDDVTERVTAETSVRESERRLDLAAGAHRIGIFDWHMPSGRVIWNGEMEDIFGIPRGSFEGTSEAFRSRVVPEDVDPVDKGIDAALAAHRDLVKYQFRLVRPGGELRAIEGSGRFVYDANGRARRMVGTVIDITSRKQAEAHQQLLINELNHRVKNTLAIVQAMAWQSFRSSGTPRAAVDAFEGRLQALAAAHDVLTRQKWEGGSIGHIIAEATAPHQDGRLVVEGPALDLAPKAAVALGLAIHELATNAVKYGALSGPAGRVEVRWMADDGKLRLTWREQGGPPVAQPTQKGFGARLLEHGLAEELRGSVRLNFLPEGLTCEVEAALN